MNERPSDDPGAPGAARPTPPTSDELLAANLRRRGSRPAPAELTRSVLARVAETPPERRWRLSLRTWRPRLALAAGGVTVALVASLLLVGSPAPHVGVTPPPGSSTPTPGATGPSTGPVWDPTVRALTPPEFLRVLASRPGVGTVLIVDDQIVGVLVSCASSDYCPDGRLVNAGLSVSAPPDGHLPFDSGSLVPGPLAIQVGEDSRLTFLGSVVSNGTRLEFKARDLAQRSAMGGLFVIPAWIHRAAIVACPSVVAPHAPLPTSELGLPAPEIAMCAGGIYSGGAYLTDADPGPAPYEIGGGDPNAFLVQQEAYQRFASDPSSDGTARRGVFLVRDWAGYGEILAGLQPIGIPTSDETAPTSTPSAAPAATVVLSLDELMARARGGGLPPGSIAVVDVPASALSNLWEPGVEHTCPSMCPEWVLRLNDQVLRIVVSVQSPMPARPVGIQAFRVEPDGSLRALGPATTGPDSRAADPLNIATDGGLAVVHGWLRVGPPIPCPIRLRDRTDPVGILGEPLAWSQCPGIWILPSPADPWAGPPNNVTATDGSGTIRFGDLSVPAGTLHVQDGATDTGLEGEGLWLVRGMVTNSCPPGAFCRLNLGDEPSAPNVTWWELVGIVVERQPPTTSATPSPPAQPVSSPASVSPEAPVSPSP